MTETILPEFTTPQGDPLPTLLFWPVEGTNARQARCRHCRRVLNTGEGHRWQMLISPHKIFYLCDQHHEYWWTYQLMAPRRDQICSQITDWIHANAVDGQGLQAARQVNETIFETGLQAEAVAEAYLEALPDLDPQTYGTFVGLAFELAGQARRQSEEVTVIHTPCKQSDGAA
jgi:hypothetical protein